MVHTDEDAVGVKDDECVEVALFSVLLPTMSTARSATCHLGSEVDPLVVGETAEVPEKKVVVVDVVEAGLAAVRGGRDKFKERGESLTRVAGAVDCVLGQEQDVHALTISWKNHCNYNRISLSRETRVSISRISQDVNNPFKNVIAPD